MTEEVQSFGMPTKAPSPLEVKKAEVDELHEMKQITFDFDEEEDFEIKKEVFSVYGHKNDGKTAVCYGIPPAGDKVLVFSFDNKSSRPRELGFIQAANLDIKVYNAIKYLDKSNADVYQATSELVQRYILSIIGQAKEKFSPDWVVIDGTEIMSGIMEQVMRLHNNLRPYQGISNLSVWKERKQYIDDIHNRIVRLANKGVIYTMYSDKDTVTKDGEVINSKDVPKWIGSVMTETDVVIRADSTFIKDKREFVVFVESKIPLKYPDGKYKVTGRRFLDVVSECL